MKKLFLVLLTIALICNFASCFMDDPNTTQTCRIKKINVEIDSENFASAVDFPSHFYINLDITHTGTLTLDDVYYVITDKSVACISNAVLTPNDGFTRMTVEIEVSKKSPFDVYFQNESGSVISETLSFYEKMPIYKISIENLDTESVYLADIGETFYLYVRPHYYSMNDYSTSYPEDISVIATTDPNSLKIEFVEICPTGDFLYKITTLNQGYCNIVAMDCEGKHETDDIFIGVSDFSAITGRTRYVVTVNSNKFHLPSCDIVSRTNLDDRLRPALTRQELRDMGYVPCKDCCG